MAKWIKFRDQHFLVEENGKVLEVIDEYVVSGKLISDPDQYMWSWQDEKWFDLENLKKRLEKRWGFA